MRTFSLLKGMPIYEKNGNLLGEVCDIVIQENGKVSHLLLQSKGFISKKLKIPFTNISSFGKDGILLENKELLSKYTGEPSEYTMHHDQPLAKKNALSEIGDQLGLLDDVYFLEEMGTIVGYELTDGFFSDITQGKRVIRTPHPPKIGKDAIIVSVTKLRGGKSYDEVSELPK
ncbi:PRC-barrel domain-containing protein [Lederbergia citri]|uniref:PRC-barrel domain-containing protein n=1 Tax=Lederbergia citri TaxID=2833580 RepID=A0A942YGK0_9BACI|nr:PRC-barrel domain-containing protein [Lederbergia citri]MBS4194779.1 PRC-barrel domain-containing protein [Lederbergia citri]